MNECLITPQPKKQIGYWVSEKWFLKKGEKKTGGDPMTNCTISKSVLNQVFALDCFMFTCLYYSYLCVMQLEINKIALMISAVICRYPRLMCLKISFESVIHRLSVFILLALLRERCVRDLFVFFLNS